MLIGLEALGIGARIKYSRVPIRWTSRPGHGPWPLIARGPCDEAVKINSFEAGLPAGGPASHPINHPRGSDAQHLHGLDPLDQRPDQPNRHGGFPRQGPAAAERHQAEGQRRLDRDVVVRLGQRQEEVVVSLTMRGVGVLGLIGKRRLLARRYATRHSLPLAPSRSLSLPLAPSAAHPHCHPRTCDSERGYASHAPSTFILGQYLFGVASISRLLRRRKNIGYCEPRLSRNSNVICICLIEFSQAAAQ
jgi:hypothetical protein